MAVTVHVEVSVPAVDGPVLRKRGAYLHGACFHTRRSHAFWIEVRKPWIKLIKLSEHPMHLRLLIVRVACAGERYATYDAACQGEVASCLGFSMGAQECGSMSGKPRHRHLVRCL